MHTSRVSRPPSAHVRTLTALALASLVACDPSTPTEPAKTGPPAPTKQVEVVPPTQSAALGACQFPATLPQNPAVTDYEQAMWQIFVAANCAAPTPTLGPLVWENWDEQGCLQTGTCSSSDPTAKPKRRLRKSTTARAVAGHLGATAGSNPFFAEDCIGDTYCEEVTFNPAEAAYVVPNLTSSSGQYAYAQTSTTTPPVNMPTGAIEVKAGWGLINSGACVPITGLHQEEFTADGQTYCYGLVGMHLSSKLVPNWIWSTFEPQYEATNPGRCAPPDATGIPAPTTPTGSGSGQTGPLSGQYGPCNDQWGSGGPASTSAPTPPTPALASLFAAQGAQLAPEFQNYRLDGVQTDFLTATGAPTLLGNSRVEGEAGVANGDASCITCHSNAMVLAGPPPAGNAFTAAMLNGVGAAAPVPAGAYQLDFSWMLNFAPGTPPAAAAPKK